MKVQIVYFSSKGNISDITREINDLDDCELLGMDIRDIFENGCKFMSIYNLEKYEKK